MPIAQLRALGVQPMHGYRIICSHPPHRPGLRRSLAHQIRPYFQFQPRCRTGPTELAVPPKGKRPQRANTATAFPQYVNGPHHKPTGVTAPLMLGIRGHPTYSPSRNLRRAPPQRFELIAQGAHQSPLPIKASQRRLILPVPIFGVFHQRRVRPLGGHGVNLPVLSGRRLGLYCNGVAASLFSSLGHCPAIPSIAIIPRPL